MAIHNDLVEAYEGIYEDDFKFDFEQGIVGPTGLSKEQYVKVRVRHRIREHTPKERLDVYLQWNGILGYTSRIWAISQGEFES